MAGEMFSRRDVRREEGKEVSLKGVMQERGGVAGGGCCRRVGVA
jgi:hypothetical protein